MQRTLILIICLALTACNSMDKYTATPRQGYIGEIVIHNDTDSTLAVCCSFPLKYKEYFTIGPMQTCRDSLYVYFIKKQRIKNDTVTDVHRSSIFFETVSMTAPVSTFEEVLESISQRYSNPSLMIRYENMDDYPETGTQCWKDYYPVIGTIRLADCIIHDKVEDDVWNFEHTQRREYHLTRFTVMASDIIPLCYKDFDNGPM